MQAAALPRKQSIYNCRYRQLCLRGNVIESCMDNAVTVIVGGHSDDKILLMCRYKNYSITHP